MNIKLFVPLILGITSVTFAAQKSQPFQYKTHSAICNALAMLTSVMSDSHVTISDCDAIWPERVTKVGKNKRKLAPVSTPSTPKEVIPQYAIVQIEQDLSDDPKSHPGSHYISYITEDVLTEPTLPQSIPFDRCDAPSITFLDPNLRDADNDSEIIDARAQKKQKNN